jgi:hypothetical protein
MYDQCGPNGYAQRRRSQIVPVHDLDIVLEPWVIVNVPMNGRTRNVGILSCDPDIHVPENPLSPNFLSP